MGNCQACLSRKSVHNSNEEEGDEEEMIRVLRTTDNELFEFPGPVSVKDLLFGFQGFAVFHNNKSHPSSIFNKQQQPLHPDTLLKFSQLYYLKPLANPSLITPLFNYDDDYKSALGNKQSPNNLWVKQALIKPLIDVGSYPPLHEDLSLGKPVLMGSLKPSSNGTSGDLIAFNAEDKALNDFAGDFFAEKSQEKVAANSSNGQEGALNELALTESSLTMSAPERSLHEHAEGLITMNAQDERAGGLPLASNAHDRTLNELAEGLLIVNAQEEHSSFDVPIQSPSQKAKRVRFSDEVMVIPSSNKLVDSGAPTSSRRRSNDTLITSKQEEVVIHEFGKANGKVDDEQGGDHQYSATKEELIPYMSKKEMNGVVRLKVVISKKQLTELMASRASSDKQSNAVMEKMLAPLLSSSHKSDSSCHNRVISSSCTSSSPPAWRPSLDHIPEDHSFHELL